MQARPKYEFKPSHDCIEYLIFGIVLLIGFIYLLSVVFDKTNPQWIEVFFTFFVGFTGSYLVYTYLQKKSIYLYEDCISFKYGFLSKSIEVHNDAIISWAEIQKSNKKEHWNELTIFTTTKKYSFPSNNYKGYDLLKEMITKDIPLDLDFEDNHKAVINRKAGLFLIVIGSFLLIIVLKSLFNNDSLNKNQLVKTEQIITSGLKIKRYKGSATIDLKCKDNPEFEFNIDAHALKEKADDFISEVSYGDTLTISISKEDFEKKINKTKPLTITDKSINYYTIPLYSIAHHGKSYLTVDEFENFKKENRQSGFWICFYFGLLLLSTGFYIRVQNQ